MKGKLTKLPRAEQWADRICTQLGKTIESIIEVGRLLVKAKHDLPDGEWIRMVNGGLLPFGKSWAAMFMAIANSQLLVNFHDRGNLPPAVGTLYQLAKADTAKLKNALKDGLVKPDMSRKAVKALLPPKKKRLPKASDVEPEESTVPLSLWSDEREATAIHDALQPVRQLVDEWPDDRSLALLVHEVKELLKYLQRIEVKTA
jgi:hypothetical protein